MSEIVEYPSNGREIPLSDFMDPSAKAQYSWEDR
jgi:hypothetical protein